MYPCRPSIPYGKRITRLFVGVAFLGLVLLLLAGSNAVLSGVGVALCAGVVSAALVIDWSGVITLRGLIAWPRIRRLRRLGLIAAWICLFPVFFCLYLVRVTIEQSGSQRLAMAPASAWRTRVALLVGSLVVCFGLISAFGSASEATSPAIQSPLSKRAAPASSPIPPGDPAAVPTFEVTTRSAPRPGLHCIAVAHHSWCASFQRGRLLFDPPTTFCSSFTCIAGFWQNTGGYVSECKDGRYSHSGGRPGDCSHHGGVLRPLYGH